MIRLAVSPCSNPDLTLETALREYGRLGFRRIELFTSWAKSAVGTGDDLPAIRRTLARHGFSVSSMHLPPLDAADPGSLDRAARTARLAFELHAPVVLVKAKTRPDYIEMAPRLLDAIRDFPLTPVLQNHAGTAISGLSDYREVLDGIDDPRMKCLLEVGHFHSVGVLWQDGYELLAGRIALVHVKDQQGSQSVPFGTGEVDLTGLMDRLQSDAYGGDVVIEMEVSDLDKKHTLRYLGEARSHVRNLMAEQHPQVVVVGAGSLSTKRIYPNLGAAGAKLVGVCDLDEVKAKRNANLWGGNVYSDLGAMLDAESPDGLIICVGPDVHAKLAPIGLARGIPVYTEKPPARTAAGALSVARAAAESNTLCMTAFKKRYSRAYVRAKEFIESFPPGDLYSLSIDYASAQYKNEPDFSRFLLDFAVHLIDLSGYLFGDAEQVFAFRKDQDAFAATVKYANGAVGSFNFNDGRSFAIPTEEVEISIRGGNFMSIHNSSHWKIARDSACTEWREPPTFTSAGDDGRDTGHLAELEDFVDAIRDGRTSSRSHVYESYKSMVLYEAIVQSADTGEVVRTEYEPLTAGDHKPQ